MEDWKPPRTMVRGMLRGFGINVPVPREDAPPVASPVSPPKPPTKTPETPRAPQWYEPNSSYSAALAETKERLDKAKADLALVRLAERLSRMGRKP